MADRCVWPHGQPPPSQTQPTPQRTVPPPLSGCTAVGLGKVSSMTEGGKGVTAVSVGAAKQGRNATPTPSAEERRGVSGGGGSTSTGVGGCLSDTEVNTAHSSTHQPVHSADTRSPCDSSATEESDDPPHSCVSSTIGGETMGLPPTAAAVATGSSLGGGGSSVHTTTTKEGSDSAAGTSGDESTRNINAPPTSTTSTENRPAPASVSTPSVRGPPKPIGFGSNDNDDEVDEVSPLYLGLGGVEEAEATPKIRRRCSSVTSSSAQGSPSMSSLHGVKPFNPNAPSHYVMPHSSSSSYLYAAVNSGYGDNNNALAAAAASSHSSSYFAQRAVYQRSPNYHGVNPFPSNPRGSATTAANASGAASNGQAHHLSSVHHSHSHNSTNSNGHPLHSNGNVGTSGGGGNPNNSNSTTGGGNRSGSTSGYQHHHSPSLTGTERGTPPLRPVPTSSPGTSSIGGGGVGHSSTLGLTSSHFFQSHHLDPYGPNVGGDTPFCGADSNVGDVPHSTPLYHSGSNHNNTTTTTTTTNNNNNNTNMNNNPNNGTSSGYYHLDSCSGYYEVASTNSVTGGQQQLLYNTSTGGLSQHHKLVSSSNGQSLHGIFSSTTTAGLQPVPSLNSPSSSCYCTPTTRCANHLHSAGGQEEYLFGSASATTTNPPHHHHNNNNMTTHLQASQHLIGLFDEFPSSPCGSNSAAYQIGGTSPAAASTTSSIAGRLHSHMHNRSLNTNHLDGAFSGYEVGAPDEIQTIETLEDLEDLCTMLLYGGEDLSVIALDLEGKDLGRNGTLCIITLATVDCVYLIDLISLGDAVLCSPDCRLRDVLESTSILKLMFDCRGDCEALYFVYQIRLVNVCDLQVASCCAHYRSAKHLPSMKTVLTRLGLLSDAEKDIKERGRNFFSPEMGGSFDSWEQRPLHPLLLQYCAVDVRHFFRAYRVLEEQVHFAIRISEERIQRVCAGHVSAKMAVRDFEIPS